jgi:hypothetical protein
VLNGGIHATAKGMDPLDIEAVTTALAKNSICQSTGVFTPAMSALDLALWDIRAALNQPVARLTAVRAAPAGYATAGCPPSVKPNSSVPASRNRCRIQGKISSAPAQMMKMRQHRAVRNRTAPLMLDAIAHLRWLKQRLAALAGRLRQELVRGNDIPSLAELPRDCHSAGFGPDDPVGGVVSRCTAAGTPTSCNPMPRSRRYQGCCASHRRSAALPVTPVFRPRPAGNGRPCPRYAGARRASRCRFATEPIQGRQLRRPAAPASFSLKD